MPKTRSVRARRPLGLERLEGRVLLAGDCEPSFVVTDVSAADPEPDCQTVFVTVAPLAAAAPVFSAGFPECDVTRPWIAAATEGGGGAVVYWLKLTTGGGVTSAQLTPIWSRLNPPSASDGSGDMNADDPATMLTSLDGLVFGGPGAPLGDTPLTFADLAGFTPPLQDGVQEYFIVARSDSDFALAALTLALVVDDMPNANDAGAGDAGGSGDAESAVAAIGDPTVSLEDEPPAPLAWLQRLKAERPFAPAGDPRSAFPAVAGSPAWLVDAQRGDPGALVLWVVEGSSGVGPAARALPVWVRFNPGETADSSLGWFGESESAGGSTTAVYPGDGGPAVVTMPTSLDGDGTRGWFVVLRTTSNFEIALATLLVAVVQTPGWNADDMAVTAQDAGPLPTGATGPAVLSSWFRSLVPSVAAPQVGLVRDTGLSDADRITRDGRLRVETDPGSRAEYSIDGGQTWRRGFRARSGVNSVQVRQVDRSGESSPATSFEFTLDRQRPAAPRVGLARGRDGERSVMGIAQGDLVASRLEPDTRLEYSVNGGAWTAALVPGKRASRVRVRQVDVAGNVSAASGPVTIWRIAAAADAAQAAPPVFSLRPRLRRV